MVWPRPRLYVMTNIVTLNGEVLSDDNTAIMHQLGETI
jgi:hypothetical protein